MTFVIYNRRDTKPPKGPRSKVWANLVSFLRLSPVASSPFKIIPWLLVRKHYLVSKGPTSSVCFDTSCLVETLTTDP